MQPLCYFLFGVSIVYTKSCVSRAHKLTGGYKLANELLPAQVSLKFYLFSLYLCFYFWIIDQWQNAYII